MNLNLWMLTGAYQLWVVDMEKISYHFFFLEISRFYHDSLSCCKLSERYSPNNFPIIKTKHLKNNNNRLADI